jgi:hypothetical protein
VPGSWGLTPVPGVWGLTPVPGGRGQGGIEDREGQRIIDVALANPHAAMKTVGFVSPIDDEALAERRLRSSPAQDRADSRDIDRAFVSTAVRFIR